MVGPHAHRIFSKIFFFTYAPLRLSVHKFLKLKVEAAVAPSGQLMIGVFSYHKPYFHIWFPKLQDPHRNYSIIQK